MMTIIIVVIINNNDDNHNDEGLPRLVSSQSPTKEGLLKVLPRDQAVDVCAAGCRDTGGERVSEKNARWGLLADGASFSSLTPVLENSTVLLVSFLRAVDRDARTCFLSCSPSIARPTSVPPVVRAGFPFHSPFFCFSTRLRRRECGSFFLFDGPSRSDQRYQFV